MKSLRVTLAAEEACGLSFVETNTMSGRPSHVFEPEELALVEEAIGLAEGMVQPSRLKAYMRQEMALLILEGAQGGETDPQKLARVAAALAGGIKKKRGR